MKKLLFMLLSFGMVLTMYSCKQEQPEDISPQINQQIITPVANIDGVWIKDSTQIITFSHDTMIWNLIDQAVQYYRYSRSGDTLTLNGLYYYDYNTQTSEPLNAYTRYMHRVDGDTLYLNRTKYYRH